MTSTRPRYDAIVVGARAAGAATAMLLARNGCSVLVLDRGRYGSDTMSTHALMRGGVLQLHRWGLLGAIVAAGTPAVRRTTFHLAGGSLPLEITPAHGVDALVAPRRTVLDPVIVDAAVAAGAEVRFGVTVTDVRRDAGGRVVGVVGRDDTGASFAADAGVVVGADGRRSVVAERVDATVVERGAHAGGFAYGYWAGVETSGYEWAYGNRTSAGLIPTNDGLTCVFVGATPERVGPQGAVTMPDLLARAPGDLVPRVTAGQPVSGVRTFTGAPGVLRRAHGPGWALVGDAGSWKDPITAHGLTDALRDAELLARALLAGAPGSRERADALDDYQLTRDRLTLPLLRIADTVAAHAWTDDEIGGLLREMSAIMADEVRVLAELPDHAVVAA